jgi:hypothetical protein
MRLHYLQEDSLVELYEGNIRRITDLKYIEKNSEASSSTKLSTVDSPSCPTRSARIACYAAHKRNNSIGGEVSTVVKDDVPKLPIHNSRSLSSHIRCHNNYDILIYEPASI